MVIYGIYLYIIVGHMKEILMCCIYFIREQVEEHTISCNVET